ncbi:hypothetical protein HPB50_007645 [Hyalomma asiaticum]|uniref:Uncharacterized protein n=1 Tax=Hyalomma asiaticum TaxID=266040 RepID=A0ACB7RHT0_HYAAI|nr:hypothetical protein HPB50_007645 [Hyalomma asiaticum]
MQGTRTRQSKSGRAPSTPFTESCAALSSDSMIEDSTPWKDRTPISVAVTTPSTAEEIATEQGSRTRREEGPADRCSSSTTFLVSSAHERVPLCAEAAGCSSFEQSREIHPERRTHFD